MKKSKVLFTLSLSPLLLASDAFANAGPPPAPAPVETRIVGPCPSTCSLTGWYVGAQLGVGMTRNVDSFNNTDVRGSNPHSMSGFIGGLHAGWGNQFSNNAYLGLEVLGNYIDNHSSSYPGDGTILKERRNNSFGIAPRFGYVWGNTMLYGRIGVESTRWVHQLRSTNTGDRKSSKKRLTGIVPGLGVSHCMGNHIVLGLESTFGFYEKSKTKNFAADFETLDNDSFSNRTFDITFRLSYKM